MTRKSPPFKRRVQDALEAAQAAGAARVQIKTCDGASFEFDLRPEILGETDEHNDFDIKPPRRGKQ